MKPLFSFALVEIDEIKAEIEKFKENQEELQQEQPTSEPDIIEALSQLLMKPAEQLQHLLDDVTTQLRILTKKPKEIGDMIRTTLDPPQEFSIQEVFLQKRIVRFYQTNTKYQTTLLLLSPIGSDLTALQNLLHTMNKYQFNTIVLGLRGFSPPIEQDTNFKMKDYCNDIRDFIEYLGPNQNIVLGLHSVMTALLFTEFIKEEYENIKKFVVISGIHRAPRTFRDGVKALPPIKLWGPFKGQVRKMTPKILFGRECNKVVHQTFINHAFSIPNQVYSEIFRDFLPKYDYTDLISRIEKPVLFLWGEEDQLIPEELRNNLISNFTSQNYFFNVLPGGHMLLLEEPSKVGQEIARFVLTERSRIQVE